LKDIPLSFIPSLTLFIEKKGLNFNMTHLQTHLQTVCFKCVNF